MVAVEMEGEAVKPELKMMSTTIEEPWSVIPGPDLRVVTSGGTSISVHSGLLASVSPVLEHMISSRPRRRGSRDKVIPILGVPCDAVVVFLRCLYSSRSPTAEHMESYGVHLLVLSHVMRVPWLKRAVTMGLGERLTVENVVDVLQLARQCDAPRLRVRCMNLIRRDYKAVKHTEGWKFVQENDPWLELEVLQFLEEADKRERLRKRMKKELAVYADLNESMECLRHICTEGCTVVGPREQNMSVKRGSCQWGSMCVGLQQLIRHFATCERKKKHILGGGGCQRCSRLWHLLRLHSTLCDRHEDCKVPLCKRFKEHEPEKKKENGEWTLLAKKVASAKVMSTLSKTKRI